MRCRSLSVPPFHRPCPWVLGLRSLPWYPTASRQPCGTGSGSKNRAKTTGSIRDFGTSNALDWTASAHEGAYEMEVSARDLDTGDAASDSLPFQFTPVVASGQAVVSPTINSLVFLYSAQSCPVGEQMKVEFTGPDGAVQQTPYQDCNGLSMNFYLGGIAPATTYAAHYKLEGGLRTITSSETRFTTGDLPEDLYRNTVLVPRTFRASNRILLGSPLNARPVANDLEGKVVWYGPDDISMLTRVEPGGDMWGIVEVPRGVPSQQIVRSSLCTCDDVARNQRRAGK